MNSSAPAFVSVPNTTSARVPWAYEAVRIVVGLVLLAAALLKAHQLVAVPLMENRNWLWIEVAMEWLLSLWLLSGWKKNVARWVAIGCFTLFCPDPILVSTPMYSFAAQNHLT